MKDNVERIKTLVEAYEKNVINYDQLLVRLKVLAEDAIKNLPY